MYIQDTGGLDISKKKIRITS